MAVNLLNATELRNWIVDTTLSLFSDNFLITIFKIIGVVLLIYILLLIIKALLRWKTSFNIGKIAENVEEINEKMDIIINKVGYIEMRQKAEEEKETEQELKEEEKKKGFFRRLFGKNKEEMEKTKEEREGEEIKEKQVLEKEKEKSKIEEGKKLKKKK